MPSRPLVSSGRLAEDARAALDALSRRLAKVDPADVPHCSLAGGQVGLALAHAYLAPLFPKRGHAAGMQAMLEAAMNAVGSRPTAPSLHSGFVGLSWLVEHLQGGQASDDEADEDPNATIDDELGRWLDHSPWDQPFDLIEGLVGVAVYALERLPRASARATLEKIVDRLGELAQTLDAGVAWPTHREWIPEQFHFDRPPRYYDLGVAHGQPGVLAVLGAMVAHGVGGTKAQDLLEKGWAYLLAQRLGGDAPSRFPTWVYPDRATAPSRDAWCYGDPGIAAALLASARAVKHRAWEDAALDVALHAARREMKQTLCVDPGLCHGSFGDAHVFLRLYRATGDKVFADRARKYLAHGLKQRARGGFAGFTALDMLEGKSKRIADPSFLTGGAGMALALAAALAPEDEDPTWDRVLAVSVRTPAAAGA